MKSINRAQIIGNLGVTPELRTTKTGQRVTNFTVATTNEYRDHNGTMCESTDWHRAVVWGAHAESCCKYLRKGRRVYIEGRLQTQSREVNGAKQYTTQIVAERVLFLDNPPDNRVAELEERIAELEAELADCEFEDEAVDSSYLRPPVLTVDE